MSSAGRSRGASIVSQARSVAMITHHLGGDIRGGCFLDDGWQFIVTWWKLGAVLIVVMFEYFSFCWVLHSLIGTREGGRCQLCPVISPKSYFSV